jgi:hypothetical protein
MRPHDLTRRKRLNTEDTYLAPAHGWTCFHCGEHFPCTDDGERLAREHFGPTPDWSPECVERRTLSDFKILELSRRARAEAQEFLEQRHEADGEADAAHCRLLPLRRFPAASVEEAFNMFHSMEGRALAAEAILAAAAEAAPDVVAAAREKVCGPEPKEGVIP